MKRWLSNLFSSPQTAEPAPELLELQTQLRSLQMQLDASQAAARQYQQENERLRARQAQLAAETAAAHLEALLQEMAAPAAQILTQASLVETQNRPVQARDILLVARRMVGALERQGMKFDETVGQQVPFNPDRHTPINPESATHPGQMVTVRVVTVLYRGSIIHKGVVE